MHHWHTANNQAVNDLRTDVGARIDQVGTDVLGDIQEALMKKQSLESQRHTERRIAFSFIQIAKSLASGTDLDVDDLEDLSLNLVSQVSTEYEDENVVRPFFSTATDPAALPVTHKVHAAYQMCHRHKRLTDMWDEWHGTGRFEDAYGGIIGRDKLYGKKWRKHLSPHLYSRTSRIIFGIKVEADVHKLTIEQAIERLEPHWDDCNHSPSNFVKYLQSIGAVNKRKARGKAKASLVTD